MAAHGIPDALFWHPFGAHVFELAAHPGTHVFDPTGVPAMSSAGQIEPQPPAPRKVTGDVAGAEELAGLAMFSEVHDRLQRDVDEVVVEFGEGAQVVEDFGQ